MDTGHVVHLTFDCCLPFSLSVVPPRVRVMRRRFVDFRRFQGHYSEKRCCELVRKMLSAVRHCHAHGLCHRDLKVHNSMCNKCCVVVGGCWWWCVAVASDARVNAGESD